MESERDLNIQIQIPSDIFSYRILKKIAALRVAFSSSCGRLQPSAATVGPFGPTYMFFLWEIFFMGNFFWRDKILLKINPRKKIW